jgi:hypothetical protein
MRLINYLFIYLFISVFLVFFIFSIYIMKRRKNHKKSKRRTNKKFKRRTNKKIKRRTRTRTKIRTKLHFGGAEAQVVSGGEKNAVQVGWDEWKGQNGNRKGLAGLDERGVTMDNLVVGAKLTFDLKNYISVDAQEADVAADSDAAADVLVEKYGQHTQYAEQLRPIIDKTTENEFTIESVATRGWQVYPSRQPDGRDVARLDHQDINLADQLEPARILSTIRPVGSDTFGIYITMDRKCPINVLSIAFNLGGPGGGGGWNFTCTYRVPNYYFGSPGMSGMSRKTPFQVLYRGDWCKGMGVRRAEGGKVRVSYRVPGKTRNFAETLPLASERLRVIAFSGDMPDVISTRPPVVD